MKVATRKDVAKLAGVSVATVSYVFNDSGLVAPKTRERVLAVANELKYVPNMLASSMTTNKTMQIAVIVNDIANTYYAEILDYFIKEASKFGYYVSISMHQSDKVEVINNLIARRVDGVFAMMVETYSRMDKLFDLVNHGIPVVVSGNALAEPEQISLVEMDYMQGLEEAIIYLKKMGHQNIAYLSSFADDNPFDIRLSSFKSVMSKHFPKTEILTIFEYGRLVSNEALGQKLTKRFLEENIDCTCIIATNDLMAFGCIEYLQKQGYHIPEDFSVVGIDSTKLCDIVHPKLTSIAIDKKLHATTAFQLLLQMLNHGTNSKEVLPMSLDIRDSVKKLN